VEQETKIGSHSWWLFGCDGSMSD